MAKRGSPITQKCVTDEEMGLLLLSGPWKTFLPSLSREGTRPWCAQAACGLGPGGGVAAWPVWVEGCSPVCAVLYSWPRRSRFWLFFKWNKCAFVYASLCWCLCFFLLSAFSNYVFRLNRILKVNASLIVEIWKLSSNSTQGFLPKQFFGKLLLRTSILWDWSGLISLPMNF